MKPSTKRLIESLRARASLISSGVMQWAKGPEHETRLDIAAMERADKPKYRREANIASYWTRIDLCRIKGINPNQGKTKHETTV